MRLRLTFLALAAAIASLAQTATSPGIILWDFTQGDQGWKAANWENPAFGPNGFTGLGKYDPQLLSPKLDVNAKDYNTLTVAIQSNLGGNGEIFLAANDEPISAKRCRRHLLEPSAELKILAFRLDESHGWEGKIQQLRFDPLNPEGAQVNITFIALSAETDGALRNGDAEFFRHDQPVDWLLGGQPNTARLDNAGAASGQRCFRLSPGAILEYPAIDMSFLGEYETVFQTTGSPIRVALHFLGRDGNLLNAVALTTSQHDGWQPYSFRATAPDRAYAAKLHIQGPTTGQAGFDACQVTRLFKAPIRSGLDIIRPRWQAAWVWHPDMLSQDHHTVWLRRQVTLPNRPWRLAALQISTDDSYSLAVNGQPVHATHGVSDAWKTPQILDLKDVLVPGDNTILVEARDVSSAQGLIAELTVEPEQGPAVRVLTDHTWEAAETPEGPWRPAKAQGRPPCLPWGDLVYQPLGQQPAISAWLSPPAGPIQAGQRLPVTVIVTTVTPGPSAPIGVRATLGQGETILTETWASNGVEITGDGGARAYAVNNLRLEVPVTAVGPAQLTVDFLGATADRPEALTANLTVLPPAKTTSAFPTVRRRTVNGVTVLEINGDIIDPSQALFTSPDDLQQRNARESGINLWGIALREFGFYEHGYDYAKVDDTIARYLNANPDAWLILNFTFDTSSHRWWIAKHPEARCQLENGDDTVGAYHGDRRHLPSYGSKLWRDTFGEALRQLLRHLRETPYAERIVGIQPCNGISWEWFHWGSQSNETVDYSPVGQQDFQRWLREKYGDDQTLQTAWNRNDVTLTTATVPSDQDRRTPAKGMFYDPLRQRHVLDYHDYQHDVVADTIAYFARIVKQESNNKLLFGTYYGYTFHLNESPFFGQGSGHYRLAKLLASPDYDYSIAPVAYAWREKGGSAATMVAAETFNRNGKLFWNQADLRSHWSHQQGHGRPTDIFGSIACMERELARNLAEGNAIQWYDFSHGWTFGDRRLTDTAAKLYDIARRHRLTTPDWPDHDYLLVVIDERQMGRADVSKPAYAGMLTHQQRNYLARAGIPWRAVLFSDLRRHPDLLNHRAMLFLNLFELSDDDSAFLRQRVMTDQRTVAFVGPAGFLSPTGPDADRASRLLGLDLTLAGEPTVLRGVGAAQAPPPWNSLAEEAWGTYGKATFAPVLLPAAKYLPTAIATLESAPEQPAAIWEKRQNHNLFWAAVPGLRPALLRGLAQTAGLPVITDQDDSVYAGRGFVGIHAGKGGVKHLRLPRPGPAMELLSGKTWPDATRITIDLNYGDTAIFINTP
ncbi:MAG: beta-galactosidase [Lentisphaeria bacterium]|nr:beta-galactosidase [Lentisphaeria bacterium]